MGTMARQIKQVGRKLVGKRRGGGKSRVGGRGRIGGERGES